MSETLISALITLGIAAVTALATLTAMAMRLSWQASRLYSVMERLSEELDDQQAQNNKEHDVIFGKLDNHEVRIDRLESSGGRSSGSWSGHEQGQG